MGTIIDIALIVVFIVSFIAMSRKGLIKAIYSLGGHIVAFILVAVLINPAAKILAETPVGQIVSDNVAGIIMQANTDENISSGNELAPVITKSLVSEGIDSVAKASVPVIADIILKILTAIILFIIIRIVIALLFGLLETLFSIPLLSQVNKLAGGIAGIVNALIIIYVVCGVLSLNFEWTNELRGIVDETRLLKYFYINNLLLKFFIH